MLQNFFGHNLQIFVLVKSFSKNKAEKLVRVKHSSLIQKKL
jgi:hypothetical protein